jgi:hypothetical protein
LVTGFLSSSPPLCAKDETENNETKPKAKVIVFMMSGLCCYLLLPWEKSKGYEHPKKISASRTPILEQ